MTLRIGLRSESHPAGSGYRSAETIRIGGPYGGEFTTLDAIGTVLGTGPGWLALVDVHGKVTEVVNPVDVASIWEAPPPAPAKGPHYPWPEPATA
jgi:hypothetical protein